MSEVFEKIFDCSPVAMILVNQDSTIQLVNKHTEILFQYAKEELIGQDISILVPQDLRHKHPALVKDYFTSPLPRKMGVGRTLFGIRKDQTKFPVEVGLNPIQTNGSLFVMSSVIDITERTKADQRFKEAVYASPNGMLMINDQGVITLCNRKVEEIFGYEKDELINELIETLVPKDFQAPHPTFVRNYAKAPKPRSMGIGRELFGKHKSGKLIPVEIGLQPISFEEENFVISSIVDVSRRREIEKKIERQSDEIKEFAYRTSHDLKSPLLTISGLVDYLAEDIKEGDIESSLEATDKIKKLTLKLNRLIDDILHLSKTDQNNEEKTVFNFNDYLNDTTEKLSFLLQKSDIKIQSAFLHKRNLYAQHTRVTQVLDNLMSNASKYCNLEKNRLIKIHTFNDKEKFYIQVEDNGQGIPIEKQEDVFGMFKRFHETNIEGTGLGLYMVKKHMEKMEAHISFESTPEGTTFYLEFPLEKAESAPKADLA